MWKEAKESQRKPFNSLTNDSDFQRDRARIIHSAAFRRLQSKTQVLSLGESDFYRTRLTHSLEAAQIGSGICEHLREKYSDNPEYMMWLPSFSLIETICLGHDLGHPPFGHGGEIALNFFMKDHGGFEGNGQTLRIIARLGEYSIDHGLDLTRRTMLGVLKYPVLHRDVSFYSEQENGNSGFRNIDYAKPPKCIHDEETEVLDWILHPLSDRDKNLFRTIDRHRDKHSKSIYKSFDTSIMELADDIAYGVHDLEDAVALDLVTLRQWKNQVASTIETMPENDIKSDLDFYKDNLSSDSSKYRKHAISKLVDFFIKSIEIREDQKFECQLLRYQAQMMSPAAKILSTFKKFIFDHVILRPEVQGLEFKGQQTVLRLFEVLSANPHRLLQKSDFEKYGSPDNKQRVICDYVAGMTDPYATRLYHRLFTPDVGSLFDRL